MRVSNVPEHPADQLAAAGIHLNEFRRGQFRVPCPECKRRTRDTALSVTVDSAGEAVWQCFRCGFKGSTRRRGDAQPAKKPERQTVSWLRRPADPWLFWPSVLPIEPDSVAAAYLKRRGCALPPYDGHLCWHPELRHPTGHVGPGLVALVTDAVTGEWMTLHRTWLAPDGSGKAAVDPPRLWWPGLPKMGGVIRLCDDADVTMGLAVAEGIENALAAARVFPTVWAAGDAGNLAQLPPLAGIEALTIIADHDRVNPRTGQRTGLAAAEACAAAWSATGVEVRIWKAETEGRDFADLAEVA